MKKIVVWLMGIAILLALLYMVGPKEKVRPLEGAYPIVPSDLNELESFITNREDTVEGLKANNEARIIWADEGNKTKTPFSIVYIHGFGASQMEGDPVHRKIAERFQANLYLSRLPEHGIKREDAFSHLSPEKLVEGAREAYSIAQALGDSVIVVGTSMGGALSIVLASERPEIKGLLLYSPCIEVYGDPLGAFFRPWSKVIMKAFMTNDQGVQMVEREGDKAKYWSEEYHINAYTSLAILLKSKMNRDTFGQVQQPLFMGYYYKDEENQDKVVSVNAMLDMYEKVSTPAGKKRKLAFPNAGDHVISSSITTDDWEKVYNESILFIEEILGVPILQDALIDSF
ncbi:alpha/beta hydrolase [Pleomorphovibrio marinus]|uniref:alpha/beta hydrolase n=1 Tax=Pleomorphovibrio marinus TaxID=2164132 RepID=UPI000E0A9CD7|nr:alpha/beta hydrolase [Pleomorphovibrio marinus]